MKHRALHTCQSCELYSESDPNSLFHLAFPWRAPMSSNSMEFLSGLFCLYVCVHTVPSNKICYCVCLPLEGSRLSSSPISNTTPARSLFGPSIQDQDREAWRAAIHGVAKSRTRLNDWSDLIWFRIGYFFLHAPGLGFRLLELPLPEYLIWLFVHTGYQSNFSTRLSAACFPPLLLHLLPVLIHLV